MAVDKKSDYVGNHGGAYTDESGMSRQFTYVDHDKKTTISIPDDGTDPKEELKKYRKSLQDKVLALPASAAPDIFDQFRTRDDQGIHWNEAMIKDEGTPLNALRDLYTLTSNKVELYLSNKLMS